MTTINSAYFNPGWRERRGLDHDDLEIPATGERLTKEKFDAFYAATEQVKDGVAPGQPLLR